MSRRTFLNWAINGVGLVVASIIAVPALLSALSPALRQRHASRWRTVGLLRKFPLGGVIKAEITAAPAEQSVGNSPARAVYVWRKSQTQTIVFSRACTDLGCAVKYDPGSEFYYCPCHGGIFNKSGEPVAGPPSRPLYQYATRLVGDVLEIDLASVPLVA